MTDEHNELAAGDAELVRYIDGELSPDDRARVEAAIAGDAQLASRLETLRARQQRLRTMLERSDTPVPDRPAEPSAHEAPAARGSAWLLRAAAIVLVLAGIVSLVPPLRAWIVDQLTRVTAPDPNAPPPPPPVSDVPDTADIAFRHVFQNFDFELVNAQREGTLRIRVAEVEQVAAEMHTRTGAEQFFHIPEGLRILNVPGSVADYEITIPPAVRRVRVVVGGRELAVYSTLPAEGKVRIFDLK